MIVIFLLLMLTLVSTYFLVVVDMARQDGAVTGCSGLFLFPVTYFWALFKYKGRRKVVASLLWGSTALMCGLILFQMEAAGRSLGGFLSATRSELGIPCQQTGELSWTGDGRFVWVACAPPNLDSVDFRNTSEMAERYQEEFGAKLAAVYGRHHTEDDRLVLIIRSPGDLYACYQVEPSGRVSRAWVTGPDDRCSR